MIGILPVVHHGIGSPPIVEYSAFPPLVHGRQVKSDPVMMAQAMADMEKQGAEAQPYRRESVGQIGRVYVWVGVYI